MGSGLKLTKRQKEQAKFKLPDYQVSPEEQKAYEYCVNNDIIISPIGISDDAGKWYIGIATPDNYKKVYKSKHIYDKDTIWQSFYEMCHYYYKKR